MTRAFGVLVMLAAPGLAEPWSCQFTVECIAGEPCAETDWQADLIAADHEGQLFLSSISGDVPVLRFSRDDPGRQVYAGLGQLLTVAQDGTAWLSSHSGVAVTYLGVCEHLR